MEEFSIQCENTQNNPYISSTAASVVLKGGGSVRAASFIFKGCQKHQTLRLREL